MGNWGHKINIFKCFNYFSWNFWHFIFLCSHLRCVCENKNHLSLTSSCRSNNSSIQSTIELLNHIPILAPQEQCISPKINIVLVFVISLTFVEYKILINTVPIYTFQYIHTIIANSGRIFGRCYSQMRRTYLEWENTRNY